MSDAYRDFVKDLERRANEYVASRQKSQVRRFATGAKRDDDADKLDYDGFLSPLVLERFAEYMHEHRKMADGSLRASDNWQKGMPQEAYMKSLLRHVMDVWKAHRGYPAVDRKTSRAVGMDEALCGVLFNAMGMLHELLRQDG